MLTTVYSVSFVGLCLLVTGISVSRPLVGLTFLVAVTPFYSILRESSTGRTKTRRRRGTPNRRPPSIRPRNGSELWGPRLPFSPKLPRKHHKMQAHQHGSTGCPQPLTPQLSLLAVDIFLKVVNQVCQTTLAIFCHQ